ncbi:MAG: lytic transglycosylase domain-containing protein [Actinomycetia bacterium]|nr:lytic transglycosylase domain-containing protein [Actinomycetes bacterium]
MSKLVGFTVLIVGLMAVPAIALLALIGLTANAIACTQFTGGSLRPSAPVPAQAKLWIALAQSACPDLPGAWIAAVMAQESGFRPNAYADDVNGGTWGLLQINEGIWRATYGAGWNADRNHNGVWDVKDPEIHAVVAGKYLCARLDGVRRIRTEHPDWVSTQDLTELDALVVAHNAGESQLETYPSIPNVTADFIRTVRHHVVAWSGPTASGSSAVAAPDQPTVDAACLASLGPASGIVVPPGTPADVATAVRTSLGLVGSRSGWAGMCDRLACRAYGFDNSGYASASVHWAAMVASDRAHVDDRCPPVGSFVFWSTSGPYGHVALVVQSDSGCDPDQIKLVSNDVLDSRTGYDGGVYLVTLTQIESGFMSRTGYLGWSDPVCAGTPLPSAASRARRVARAG